MKRKIVTGLLIVCLFLGSYADWVKAASFSPSLSFSGNIASCDVTIQQAGKQISATMELWCGTTLVDSWSGTRKNILSLSGTHSGYVSGWTYTLKINGTIGGVAFSELTVTKTC